MARETAATSKPSGTADVSSSRIDRRRKHAQASPTEEYSQRRAAIVDVAAKLFETASYDRISMNDVATAAGADRATIYYYFRGKRELFFAVIRGVVERNVAFAEEVSSSSADPRTKLRTIIRELLESYEENYPNLYVFLQQDLTKLPDEGADSNRDFLGLTRRYNSAVERVIRSGIDAGLFDSELDSEVAMFAVVGALGWTHRWFTPADKRHAIDIARSFEAIFVRGISR